MDGAITDFLKNSLSFRKPLAVYMSPYQKHKLEQVHFKNSQN